MGLVRFVVATFMALMAMNCLTTNLMNGIGEVGSSNIHGANGNELPYYKPNGNGEVGSSDIYGANGNKLPYYEPVVLLTKGEKSDAYSFLRFRYPTP